MIAIAKIEMKPTAADTLNGVSSDDQSQYAAQTGHRNLRHQDKSIDRRQRCRKQNAHDEEHGNGNDNRQAAIGGLQFAIFADPFHMRAFGQLHLLRHLLLHIGDRALKVAPGHRKPHRYIALEVAAINERGALGSLNIGDLSQRHIAAGRHVDANVAHRVKVFAVFRLPAQNQSEAAVALEHLGDGLAADSGLHDGRDVAGIKSVARSGLAVGRTTMLG